MQTLGVSILCRLSLQCQISLLFPPSVGIRQGLLWLSNRLELQIYPSLECYDAIKLFVELFDLLVFVVLGWCIDLDDCDVVWSREIWMEMSLLEMGVQVMILPTTCSRAMNAAPYWCFESSPQYLILCPRPWQFLQTLTI